MIFSCKMKSMIYFLCCWISVNIFSLLGIQCNDVSVCTDGTAAGNSVTISSIGSSITSTCYCNIDMCGSARSVIRYAFSSTQNPLNCGIRFTIENTISTVSFSCASTATSFTGSNIILTFSNTINDQSVKAHMTITPDGDTSTVSVSCLNESTTKPQYNANCPTTTNILSTTPKTKSTTTTEIPTTSLTQTTTTTFPSTTTAPASSTTITNVNVCTDEIVAGKSVTISSIGVPITGACYCNIDICGSANSVFKYDSSSTQQPFSCGIRFTIENTIRTVSLHCASAATTFTGSNNILTFSNTINDQSAEAHLTITPDGDTSTVSVSCLNEGTPKPQYNVNCPTTTTTTNILSTTPKTTPTTTTEIPTTSLTQTTTTTFPSTTTAPAPSTTTTNVNVCTNGNVARKSVTISSIGLPITSACYCNINICGSAKSVIIYDFSSTQNTFNCGISFEVENTINKVSFSKCGSTAVSFTGSNLILTFSNTITDPSAEAHLTITPDGDNSNASVSCLLEGAPKPQYNINCQTQAITTSTSTTPIPTTTTNIHKTTTIPTITTTITKMKKTPTKIPTSTTTVTFTTKSSSTRSTSTPDQGLRTTRLVSSTSSSLTSTFSSITTEVSTEKRSIGKDAIAGISAGAVALLIVIIIMIVCIIKNRTNIKEDHYADLSNNRDNNDGYDQLNNIARSSV